MQKMNVRIRTVVSLDMTICDQEIANNCNHLLSKIQQCKLVLNNTEKTMLNFQGLLMQNKLVMVIFCFFWCAQKMHQNLLRNSNGHILTINEYFPKIE